jgi:hypothetical protein
MDSNILAAARPIASPLEVFGSPALASVRVPTPVVEAGRHPKTFTIATDLGARR